MRFSGVLRAFSDTPKNRVLFVTTLLAGAQFVFAFFLGLITAPVLEEQKVDLLATAKVGF